MNKRSGPCNRHGTGQLSFFHNQNLFRIHEDVATTDRQRDVAEVVDCLAASTEHVGWLSSTFEDNQSVPPVTSLFL